MYIDRNELTEYPYEGHFYRGEINESASLLDQTDVRTLILSVDCDITEAGHTRQSGFLEASFAIYFHIDCEVDELPIIRGDIFESNQYGLEVNGKVVGIFPSQLHGCVVYINDTDI